MPTAKQLIQQTDRRIQQLEHKIHAERPPPPSITVFSSHLATVHSHVRVFRELLCWVIEDGSFPFAQHWVHNLVGAECTDEDALAMLKHQVSNARGSAAEEAEMRSTNDYSRLEESIVCHLGAIFLMLKNELPSDAAARFGHQQQQQQEAMLGKGVVSEEGKMNSPGDSTFAQGDGMFFTTTHNTTTAAAAGRGRSSSISSAQQRDESANSTEADQESSYGTNKMTTLMKLNAKSPQKNDFIDNLREQRRRSSIIHQQQLAQAVGAASGGGGGGGGGAPTLTSSSFGPGLTGIDGDSSLESPMASSRRQAKNNKEEQGDNHRNDHSTTRNAVEEEEEKNPLNSTQSPENVAALHQQEEDGNNGATMTNINAAAPPLHPQQSAMGQSATSGGGGGGAGISSVQQQQQQQSAVNKHQHMRKNQSAHLAIAKMVCRPGSASANQAQLPPHAALEDVLHDHLLEKRKHEVGPKVSPRIEAEKVEKAKTFAEQRKRLKSSSYGANKTLNTIYYSPRAPQNAGEKMSVRARPLSAAVVAAGGGPGNATTKPLVMPVTHITNTVAAGSVSQNSRKKELHSPEVKGWEEDGVGVGLNDQDDEDGIHVVRQPQGGGNGAQVLHTTTGWTLLTQLQEGVGGPDGSGSRPHTARAPGHATRGFTGTGFSLKSTGAVPPSARKSTTRSGGGRHHPPAGGVSSARVHSAKSKTQHPASNGQGLFGGDQHNTVYGSIVQPTEFKATWNPHDEKLWLKGELPDV